jgi:hypothetical protein
VFFRELCRTYAGVYICQLDMTMSQHIVILIGLNQIVASVTKWRVRRRQFRTVICSGIVIYEQYRRPSSIYAKLIGAQLRGLICDKYSRLDSPNQNQMVMQQYS